MATVSTVKIDNLTPDNSNANKGTVRGAAALENSLRKYGAGRSILVDKHGRVIAGNKTLGKAAEIGLEDVIIVETDGNQIVAVKRTDLDLRDERARKLAYADNRVGQLDLDWDAEQLLADIDSGLDLGDLFDKSELDVILNGLDGVEWKEFDEDIADGFVLMAKFRIDIPQDVAEEFNNALKELVSGYPNAKVQRVD